MFCWNELVISPNTPTENYYKISAIGAKAVETLVVPQGTTHTVGVSWDGSVWYLDSDQERLFVNGDLEWTPRGGDQFITSIPEQRLSKVGDVAAKSYMFMSDGAHDCPDGTT